MISIATSTSGFFILGSKTLQQGTLYTRIDTNGLVTIKNKLGETLVSGVSYTGFCDGNNSNAAFTTAAQLTAKLAAVGANA